MRIGVLLFDQFEILDASGPISALMRVADSQLYLLSMLGGMVSSQQQIRLQTITYSAEMSLDVLLVPGGQGTRELANCPPFLEMLRDIDQHSQYCLGVCTGSVLLAQAGLLQGKRATSNKRAFNWVSHVNNSVNWQKSARWVKDGKYYTSSGVTAGIDMALGFIADQLDLDLARDIAHQLEYCWQEQADIDPFSLK